MTGKIHTDLLEGDKLYQQRARQAFPLLVRQAKSQEPLYYSELAEEMDMPNARNLNYILGYIGHALLELAKREKVKDIPAINCLVVSKSTNLPGEGIDFFLPKKKFYGLPKNQQRRHLKQLLTDIYLYQKWDWVLEKLGLEPYQGKLQRKLSKDVPKHSGKRGGESPEHLRFKNFIAKHPEFFGLPPNIKGETEFEFPSMDTIDILFKNGEELVGIEVKSNISDIYDLTRGVFQCIKYKALIDAFQIVNNNQPNSRVVLALESFLPKELVSVKNQLGISVLEMKKRKRKNVPIS